MNKAAATLDKKLEAWFQKDLWLTRLLYLGPCSFIKALLTLYSPDQGVV